MAYLVTRLKNAEGAWVDDEVGYPGLFVSASTLRRALEEYNRKMFSGEAEPAQGEEYQVIPVDMNAVEDVKVTKRSVSLKIEPVEH